MQRGMLFVAILGLAVVPAHADTIAITGGAVLVENGNVNHFDLSGTGGFGIDAVYDFTGAEGNLATGCPCPPSTLMNIEGTVSGSGFSGTAQFDGATFQLNTGSSVGLTFLADPIVLPPLNTAALLSAPFEMQGNLFLFDLGGQPTVTLPLFGRGTVRIALTPDRAVGSDLWALDEARYEFAPIPEPGTLLFVAAGIIGAAWRRRALFV